MARRLIYKIADNGENEISDLQWQRIVELQNWYNSEFFWSAGKLAFKMFITFLDYKSCENRDEHIRRIKQIRHTLKIRGATECEVLKTLEKMGLVFIKKGGYFENCLASGYTRVGQNEFNAYLVCEFLIKVSLIAEKAQIEIQDEGNFIKCKKIIFKSGDLIIPCISEAQKLEAEKLIGIRRVFSIVNPKKYDNFPKLRHQFSNYNKFSKREKRNILHNWNYLGFEDSYDLDGDDIEGYDLNKKVKRFMLEVEN